MFNLIGGAQPIAAVLKAFPHFIPHVWVSSRCFPSPYEQSVFIVHKFFENSLVHGHYGDSNRRPFEIQVSRSPTEPPTLLIIIANNITKTISFCYLKQVSCTNTISIDGIQAQKLTDQNQIGTFMIRP